eukprot:353687-Chlamydomonas_euryale.AAC.1
MSFIEPPGDLTWGMHMHKHPPMSFIEPPGDLTWGMRRHPHSFNLLGHARIRPWYSMADMQL